MRSVGAPAGAAAADAMLPYAWPSATGTDSGSAGNADCWGVAAGAGAGDLAISRSPRWAPEGNLKFPRAHQHRAAAPRTAADADASTSLAQPIVQPRSRNHGTVGGAAAAGTSGAVSVRAGASAARGMFDFGTSPGILLYDICAGGGGERFSTICTKQHTHISLASDIIEIRARFGKRAGPLTFKWQTRV